MEKNLSDAQILDGVYSRGDQAADSDRSSVAFLKDSCEWKWGGIFEAQCEKIQDLN